MHQFLEKANAIAADILGDRRYFHENPEVGFDLPGTTSHIMKRLTEMGYAPVEITRGGVVATVGKPGGKVFLLRADTDALPMKETTGLPYSSKNDYAHSCGHDLHAASLLGAAKILKDMEGELEGLVKLMFQPCEEMLQGAQAMLDAGLLENPAVDAALAIHSASLVPCGEVRYSDGAVNASADAFKITVTGRGGHGASPEKCIDPLHTACQIVISAQEIIARETAGMDTAVLTFGQLVAGDKENIIPETAIMKGTIRTYDHEVRANIKKRLVEVATGIATTFRCECEVEYMFGVAPNINNPEVQSDVIGYVTELLGEDKVDTQRPGMGSEDFSLVAEQVPSMFLSLGYMVDDADKVFSHHSPNVVFKEDALPVNAAVYAYVAKRWLEEHK